MHAFDGAGAETFPPVEPHALDKEPARIDHPETHKPIRRVLATTLSGLSLTKDQNPGFRHCSDRIGHHQTDRASALTRSDDSVRTR